MLIKDRDGKYSYHGLAHDQASVCVNRQSSTTVFQVYRPDGLYAKIVGTFRVLQSAENFCRDQGWEQV